MTMRQWAILAVVRELGEATPLQIARTLQGERIWINPFEYYGDLDSLETQGRLTSELRQAPDPERDAARGHRPERVYRIKE